MWARQSDPCCKENANESVQRSNYHEHHEFKGNCNYTFYTAELILSTMMSDSDEECSLPSSLFDQRITGTMTVRNPDILLSHALLPELHVGFSLALRTSNISMSELTQRQYKRDLAYHVMHTKIVKAFH